MKLMVVLTVWVTLSESLDFVSNNGAFVPRRTGGVLSFCPSSPPVLYLLYSFSARLD